MKLNEISDNFGARKKSRPLGRGIGSGRGKTSSRGGKGQTARTGVSIKGFEGGQMPLVRRLPKVGFTNIHRLKYTQLNLYRLQIALDEKILTADQVIDEEALVAAGLLKKARDGIRILGQGELTHKITLRVSGASSSAKKAVEALGGSIEI
jgi:large subunit ribosomal protein L15